MALQMTWTNAHKRKNAPLGLRNLGNSCYLNSVLQCLTYTPPLANFCLNNQHSSLCELSNLNKKHDCPFCMLERRIVRSLSIEIPMDAPAKIQSSIQIFAKHFQLGRQEDAHEFLRYVIDACHNTCLKLLKARNGVTHQNGQANGKFEKVEPKTIVKEIFGGLLQSQVKCLSCGYESNKMDDIMDISLDLFQSSSLKEALQFFFQQEVLDGSNKYNCEKCKSLSVAKKQLSMWRAPNVLVIQLKRFEGTHGMKIDRRITFQEDLSLSAHMSTASKDPHPQYSLFGSIVHSGFSPESGHYYAYIKDAKGHWYRCNDSVVTLSTLEEVLSEKVYILFFVRSNQRSKVVKYVSQSANGGSSCISNEAPIVKGLKATAHMRKQSPTVLTNGNCPAKGVSNVSNIEANPSKARIKFNISRTTLSESVKVVANGCGESNIHHKASKERLRRTEDLSCPMHKKEPLASRDSVGADLSDKDMNSIADRSSVLPCHFNNTTSNIKRSFDGDGKNAVGASGEKEHNLPHVGVVSSISSSDIVETKRKMCDSNSADIANSSSHPFYDLSEQGTRCKSSSIKEHFAVEFELKEMLYQQASSFLRTSCWYDGVFTLMRHKKRLCMRDPNIPDTDRKRLLISEAKQAFNSQIPHALKESLLKAIQPFISRHQ